MKIGYHLPVKKPLHTCIKKEHEMYNKRYKAFQIFLKTPRRNILSNISDEDARKCNRYIKDNNIYLVIHSSYLLNIATKIEKNNEHVFLSAIDDIKYASHLGASGAVFHLGKSLKRDKEECINNMYNFIINVIDSTPEYDSKFILETGAGCGTEICSSIIELGEFYSRFNDKYKNRVKICIDTCHIFSSNHDIRTKNNAENFISDVEKHIGWINIELIHLNDSKTKLGSRVDRHENLCKGYIGKESDEGFKTLIKHFKKMNIPIILETPGSKIEDLKLIEKWLN